MSYDIIRENSLCVADCLDVLKEWYNTGIRSFIDLIYIDPPFNSKRNYNIIHSSNISKMSETAFKDTWSNVPYNDSLEDMKEINPRFYEFIKFYIEKTDLPKSYISYIVTVGIRCWYMREMLSETGSFYFHCDPTMSHYVKVILDFIFGNDKFRNEIIWNYKSGGAGKTHFSKKHDVILFYTKTNNYTFNVQKEKSYNRDFKKYGFEGVEEFEDDIGWYTMINCTSVWNINMVGRTSKERFGYPTQKPEKLIERIIRTSSNKEDKVADFFMGGGTTISVADKLDRRWYGCDIATRALQITKNRLEKNNKLGINKKYFLDGIPRSAHDLRILLDNGILSNFDLEETIIKYFLPNNVVGNDKKIGDGGVDARFSFDYLNKSYMGLIQITSSANMNHFKAFCSEVSKQNYFLGVYMTFEDKVTSGMINNAKSYGRIGDVDKLQILTFENLIDNSGMIELPAVKDSYFKKFKTPKSPHESFFVTNG